MIFLVDFLFIRALHRALKEVGPCGGIAWFFPMFLLKV